VYCGSDATERWQAVNSVNADVKKRSFRRADACHGVLTSLQRAVAAPEKK